jgi:hypothetical protein
MSIGVRVVDDVEDMRTAAPATPARRVEAGSTGLWMLNTFSQPRDLSELRRGLGTRSTLRLRTSFLRSDEYPERQESQMNSTPFRSTTTCA